MRRCVAFLLCLLPFLGHGQMRFPDKPTSTMVSDGAHLLTRANIASITSTSHRYRQRVGAPIVVATIPSLASMGASGKSIEQYAKQLFDHWRIGSVNQNRGVLFLISKGDHKARFELGRDYGHDMDEECHDVMQTYVIPSFKEGHFSQGILGGVNGVEARLTLEKSAEPMARGVSYALPPMMLTSPPFDPFPIFGTVCSVTVILMIVGVVSGVARGRRGGTAAGAAGSWWLMRNSSTSTSSSTDSSFSSGFTDSGSSASSGSFDGGSSGGGGDTGSW